MTLENWKVPRNADANKEPFLPMYYSSSSKSLVGNFAEKYSQVTIQNKDGVEDLTALSSGSVPRDFAEIVGM